MIDSCQHIIYTYLQLIKNLILDSWLCKVEPLTKQATHNEEHDAVLTWDDHICVQIFFCFTFCFCDKI